MASKKKFKRDYIILEAKDLSFRFKDKVSPKAFAKIEVTDDKSIMALYAENLKYVSDGYEVVIIRSDYEIIDLGNIKVNEQGKSEFTFNMGDEDIDIKGVALVHDRNVPLIGFKGNKIENYNDILFPQQYEFEDVEEEYEEVEYIEVEDGIDDNEEYEYEEVEYIEVEEGDDEEDYEYECEEYVDTEYEDVPYEGLTNRKHEYEEYEEIIYEEYEEYEDENEYEYEYEEIVEEVKKTNKPKPKVKSTINKQSINDTNKRPYAYVNNKSENVKTASTLLMPRQIKKGLKYFREVKPFVSDYIESTRWWKIEINPTTMCGYAMPYLGYINTLNYTMYSDAAMQSYKYRHYLYGVQYDEYNKRQYYIYAVPGRKNEQPDQGHTGFTRYQPCDNRNNSLGYWLCFVDCKARKILK